MKLISLNIELNRHTARVLDFLKKEKADVVCMQELLEEDFIFYKEELGLEGVFQIMNYVGDPTHIESRGKKEGIAIFAKNIIDQGSIFYLGKEKNLDKAFDENLSVEELKINKAILWIDVLGENKKLYKFITTHFVVTKDGEATSYQLEVLDLLLEKLSSFKEFIFCGDMNAPRGRETFSRLAKIYKDNIPLEYKTSIDQNLHRVKGLQLMVDGLFTTPKYEAFNVKFTDGISDHMAIVANLY